MISPSIHTVPNHSSPTYAILQKNLTQRDSFSHLNSTLQSIVHKLLEGRAIEFSEACLFSNANPHELYGLCEAGRQIRDAGKGSTISFSPKVFIPLTEIKDLNDGPYCYMQYSQLSNPKIKPSPVIFCPANQGDMIISYQNGLHRGSPQKEGRIRKMLVFGFKQRKFVYKQR